MKTTVVKQAFADANAAMKSVVGKDALSVFSRVRLDVAGDNVSLTGTDGDRQLEWRIKGESQIHGTIAVPGLRLAAFASAMPDGQVEITSIGEERLELAGGEGVFFRLSAFDADSYPVMAGPKSAEAVSLPAVTFRELLRKVKFAAAQKEVRALLNGVNICKQDGMLQMTATDGRRLAHVEYDITRDSDLPDFDVTLPNNTVNMLFALLARDDDENVDFTSDGKAMRIVCGKWCLTAKLVEGAYPAWRRVVPGDLSHVAIIDRAEFLGALARAALAADPDNPCVKVTVSQGRVAFEARSENAEAKFATTKCKLADDVKEWWRFDPRLLKEALDAIDDDEFQLNFRESEKGKTSPVLLKCSAPWLAVVMPLRVG